MEKIRPVIYRTFFIAILLVVFNFIYTKFFFEKDLQKHSPIINTIRNVIDEKSEIIYLGESSNTTFREDDADKRPISEMISDYYPKRKFGTINKEASHSGIYYSFLKAIPENNSIKTVIVTLNLRSFDASWIYSNLETALQKSIVLIRPYAPLVNRLLLSFKAYDIKSDQEREVQFKKAWANDKLVFDHPFPFDNVIDWDSAMAIKGIYDADGKLNVRETELACHYIKTYAFQIDPEKNPRIKDFDRIVELAKEKNWNLVFNLMAENVDKAGALAGKELVSLIKQNRDFLVQRYSAAGVTVADNLELIPNDEFVDQNWTTEHYAESGRRLIAKNAAIALQKFYPGEFIDSISSIAKKNKFFNDCEGEVKWAQMQTLTDEISHSGKSSSRTGQEQDFSIAFEYGVKHLPDSLKNVEINFYKFQKALNAEAKIVIEISGSRVEYQWNGFLLKDLAKGLNRWEKINYNFTLPPDFYNASTIKIYVFNPANEIIYVDDFSIEFRK